MVPVTPWHTKVREGINKTVAEVIAWSLHHAAAGQYPETGFYGEAFDNNTYRHHLRGKPIAGSFKSLV